MKSDGDSYTRFDTHLYLIARPVRYRLAVLDEAFHYHLHHFLDVLYRFGSGLAPSSRTVAFQSRTVRMPAILIGFHDDAKSVGFHGGVALSGRLIAASTYQAHPHSRTLRHYAIAVSSQ